ncbi:G-protein coupled receptor dmsr-1-like [Tenebrio molitor]|uniref:G-protein coupled receptor dmsr-1-like n=1 Tax=Tenebrio molitor TaxID=7067 RepID=UPI0036248F07
MAVLGSHNLKLFQAVNSLSDSNDTYNLTENDLQVLQNLLSVLKHKRNASNFAESSQSEENCGGQLRNFAETYANHYHSYFAIFVCVFGTIANVLNIIVLTRKDTVCAPINRILTALAVADILLMVEYIPYVYYYYMALPKTLDFPYRGAIYMLFHVHITQILHTTSVCLNLTLAVWRYLALRYPARKHIVCSEFRCTLGIGISYVLPLILCIPTYTAISITKREIIENETRYTLYHTDLSDMFKANNTLLKINFWIYAVLIKLLPCCILTVISCWLIRTVFNAKKRKQVLRSYDCYPLTETGTKKREVSKTERRADRTTKMLVAVLILFLITEFPQGIFAFLIGIKGKHLFLECYQLYGELMDILALINGAINFILYCFMNRMFRTTFGQVFKNKILCWTSLVLNVGTLCVYF